VTAELNGTFHLSPNENILSIALINIHYLFYIIILLKPSFHAACPAVDFRYYRI
jgi:hypothetical protein